jgi:hypothetical protein
MQSYVKYTELNMLDEKNFLTKLDLSLGKRFLGTSMTINSNYDIAVGIRNNQTSKSF